MSQYTLKFGDATRAEMYPDEEADLILFDPPYFPEIHKYPQRLHHKNKTTKKWTQPKKKLKPIITPMTHTAFYSFWRGVCWEAMKRLKTTGWYLYKCDDTTLQRLCWITEQYYQFFHKNIVWDKTNYGLGTIIRNAHELITVYRSIEFKHSYCLNPCNFSSVLPAVDIPQSYTKESLDKFAWTIECLNLNRGRFDKKVQMEQINQTPLGVWIPIIDQFCPPDGLVLDPTMGSGSIALAVKYLNSHGAHRRYWGIELDRSFFQLAKRNVNPDTCLTKLKVNAKQTMLTELTQ
jgi:DNA modification methylase